MERGLEAIKEMKTAISIPAGWVFTGYHADGTALYSKPKSKSCGPASGQGEARHAGGDAHVHIEPARPAKRLSDKPLTPEDRLNKTEKAFLCRLRSGELGKFTWIGIQCVTLQLAFDCRYTPDFATRMEGGDFRLWEVKGGYVREDGWIKLKMAARLFPFWTFVKAQRDDAKSPWVEKVIEA